MAHTLWSLLFSKSKQIHLLPIAVSLTEFFQWDMKNLSFITSWYQALWVLAGLKSQSVTTDSLSTAQSPCYVGLSPSLKSIVSNTTFPIQERWWPAQYLVNSGIGGEKNWKTGGKSSGKNVLRNPLYNLPENLLNTWPGLTVFIGLILGTKIKDRRTPTSLGNSF